MHSALGHRERVCHWSQLSPTGHRLWSSEKGLVGNERGLRCNAVKSKSGQNPNPSSALAGQLSPAADSQGLAASGIPADCLRATNLADISPLLFLT